MTDSKIITKKHIVFQVINFVFSDKSANYLLSHAEINLLIKLSSHSGLTGIHPSIALLGRDMRLGERQVSRLLHSLHNKNLIKIEKCEGKVSRYKLLFINTTQDINVTTDKIVTPVTHDTTPLTSVSPTPDICVTTLKKNSFINSFSNNLSLGSKKKKKSKPKKKKHDCPEEMRPNEKHYALGKKLNIDVDYEFDKMKDHFAGKGEMKVDWSRTFNNWIKNAAEWKSKGNGFLKNEIIRPASDARTMDERLRESDEKQFLDGTWRKCSLLVEQEMRRRGNFEEYESNRLKEIQEWRQRNAHKIQEMGAVK